MTQQKFSRTWSREEEAQAVRESAFGLVLWVVIALGFIFVLYVAAKLFMWAVL